MLYSRVVCSARRCRRRPKHRAIVDVPVPPRDEGEGDPLLLVAGRALGRNEEDRATERWEEGTMTGNPNADAGMIANNRTVVHPIVVRVVS